jgi:hypothetical protein
MRKLMRLFAALSLVVTAMTVQLATASPAAAACPPETFYVASGPLTPGWRTSNTFSEWLAGPGNISRTVNTTATVTLGGSLSGGVSFSASLVVISIEERVDVTVDLSVSRSRTAGFIYNIIIDPGTTARAVVSERAYASTVKKVVAHPNCTATEYPGYFQAPYTQFDASTTCIYRDRWPATSFQASSGGCFAE